MKLRKKKWQKKQEIKRVMMEAAKSNENDNKVDLENELKKAEQEMMKNPVLSKHQVNAEKFLEKLKKNVKILRLADT